MKIKLPNRDGVEVWLEKLSSGRWSLKSSQEYITKYLRVGYKEDGEIEFIDPPGGPFLQVGGEVSGRKILGITDDLEIILGEQNFTIFDGNGWTVYYQGSLNRFKDFLEEEGFIDADVLGPSWFVFWHEVYKLPNDWRNKLQENEYLSLDYIGHLEHVIPKKERTTEQQNFIKNIFEGR
jgi:hypothetical protein